MQTATRVIGYDDDDNEIIEELPFIRPCWKCGKAAKWQDEPDELFILCKACGEFLLFEPCVSADDLAAVWNDRPLEDRLRERIAELELLVAESELDVDILESAAKYA